MVHDINDGYTYYGSTLTHSNVMLKDGTKMESPLQHLAQEILQHPGDIYITGTQKNSTEKGN